MRILIYFADMVAGHFIRMSEHSSLEFSLENLLNKLGGISFTNCYSPAPDTPRTLATVFSGLPPSENGCDRRDKWPGHDLSLEAHSIFKVAIQRGFRVSALLSNTELSTNRFLPADCRNQVGVFSQVNDLIQTVRTSSVTNELIFIQDNDCHFSVSDHFALVAGHRLGMRRVAANLQYVIDGFGKDNFDAILIFSDHGFAPLRLLNRRSSLRFSGLHRPKVLFHFWSRELDRIQTCSRLTSTVEIGLVIRTMLQTLCTDDPVRELMFSPGQAAIVVEDYSSHATSPGSTPDTWCVITPQHIYVESANGESLALSLTLGRRRGASQVRFTPSVEELDSFRRVLHTKSESFRCWDQLRKSLGTDLPEITTYMDSTLRTRGHKALLRIIGTWLNMLCIRLRR